MVKSEQKQQEHYDIYQKYFHGVKNINFKVVKDQNKLTQSLSTLRRIKERGDQEPGRKRYFEKEIIQQIPEDIFSKKLHVIQAYLQNTGKELNQNIQSNACFSFKYIVQLKKDKKSLKQNAEQELNKVQETLEFNKNLSRDFLNEDSQSEPRIDFSLFNSYELPHFEFRSSEFCPSSPLQIQNDENLQTNLSCQNEANSLQPIEPFFYNQQSQHLENNKLDVSLQDISPFQQPSLEPSTKFQAPMWHKQIPMSEELKEFNSDVEQGYQDTNEYLEWQSTGIFESQDSIFPQNERCYLKQDFSFQNISNSHQEYFENILE